MNKKQKLYEKLKLCRNCGKNISSLQSDIDGSICTVCYYVEIMEKIDKLKKEQNE